MLDNQQLEWTGPAERSFTLVVWSAPGRPFNVGPVSRQEQLVSPVPSKIGGATVICYSPIDGRHRHTGNCRQVVAGVLQGAMAGLAICQYEGEDSFYLFGCDENWQTVTDTWHQTVEEAKDQAEFEYEGVSSTWVSAAGWT